MPETLVETMWLSITQIEAQEMLKQMSIADFPNLKKQDRVKKHKDLHRQAFPNHMKESPKKITPQDLQRILAR